LLASALWFVFRERSSSFPILELAFILLSCAALSFALRKPGRHQRSRTSQLEIARRLAQAIEMRDSNTGEHNERIARYCQVLGESLGLPHHELDALVRVAPLHDVGKIAISDAVLQKPGPLDPHEI